MAQSLDEDAVLPEVDWSPLEKEEVYALGLPENWPQLRQILTPVTSNKFGVTDAASQTVLDEARFALDVSWGDVYLTDPSIKRNMNCYIVGIVIANGGTDGAAQVLELLLAAGVDPDQPDSLKWRPSHDCGLFGHLELASSLFLCRPDMTAKNGSGNTPMGAAEGTHPEDDEVPTRSATRSYVAKFIKDNSFEAKFPNLAELALQKKWFAVKNLVRRQVVEPEEFGETFHGKTAAGWAEFHGESMVAEEIKYYEQPGSSKLAKAGKELLDLKREVFSLKAKMTQVEQESAEKDSKIKELAEVVEVLSSGKMDPAKHVDIAA